MVEVVNEPVAVIASFGQTSRGSAKVIPHVLQWRERRYTLGTMGMHHPERRGDKNIHIFTFSSGDLAFRLELDPEFLKWTLMEISDGLPS
jgi:hypothetical protein